MSTDNFQVDLVERELIDVELTTIDVLPQMGATEDLVYNEIPTQITSTRFRTAYNYEIGTLQVFLNGLKERYVTRTGSNEFTFDLATISTDIVEVSYIKT